MYPPKILTEQVNRDFAKRSSGFLFKKKAPGNQAWSPGGRGSDCHGGGDRRPRPRPRRGGRPRKIPRKIATTPSRIRPTAHWMSQENPLPSPVRSPLRNFGTTFFIPMMVKRPWVMRRRRSSTPMYCTISCVMCGCMGYLLFVVNIIV